MSFEPRDYLKHILAEADYLLGRSFDLTFEAFVADETLRRAFVRSLEVIGEATKKVPEDFRASHPTLEWRAMAGMRDRLIHDLLRRRLRVGVGRCSESDSGVAEPD
jgi:uncharacterized protein with HEPN domain